MSWIAPARRTMTAATARQRGFRLLAIVGATAVVTLVSQPAAATQPEPPAESEPIEAADDDDLRATGNDVGADIDCRTNDRGAFHRGVHHHHDRVADADCSAGRVFGERRV